MDLERANAFGDVKGENSNKILTNEDLEQLNLCLKIRRIASSKDLKLDTSVHKVTFNTYILDFIKAVGLEPLDFIRDYLRSIQPYMIRRDRNQEITKNTRCIIDFTYYIPFYIKVDMTQFNELIVSFHEDYNRKDFSINKTQEYYLLITDKKLERSPEEQVFSSTIPRGFMFLNYRSFSYILDHNCVKVRKNDLDTFISGTVIELLNTFVESDKFDIINSDISFTSYGDHILNNISLVVDLIMSNSKNKRFTLAASTTLLDLLSQLEQMTDSENLKRILINRFSTRNLNKLSSTSLETLNSVINLIGGSHET